MKNRNIIVIILICLCVIAVVLLFWKKEDVTAPASSIEQSQPSKKQGEASAEQSQPSGDQVKPSVEQSQPSEEQVKLSEEQAVEAIKSYCYSLNQDLEQIVNDGEYQVYWTVTSSDENEIVVLYRSYTGALDRFYIDRASGEAYVTESVPGIAPEETRTEESLNVWDYVK